jgi:hypothetical protein
LTTNQYGVFVNTVTNAVKLWVNVNGSMKSVTLS